VTAATHNSEFGHIVTHVTNVGRRQPMNSALWKSQSKVQITAQTIRAHIVTNIRNVWRVGGRCHFQPLAISSKPLRRFSGAGIDGAGARVALLETIGRAAARPLYVLHCCAALRRWSGHRPRPIKIARRKGMTLLARLGEQLPERNYLGIDVGYKEHVAVVITLQNFA